MVQIAPLGDPLHVRLEPHWSSPSLHILSKAADEVVSITQPTVPAQHSLVTSFFSSSQLLPPQASAEDSRVARPTTTIHDLIDLIVSSFPVSRRTVRIVCFYAVAYITPGPDLNRYLGATDLLETVSAYM